MEFYYYRASGGSEIDLILRISSRKLWAIDIKHGVAPKIRPGFHQASEDVRATRKFVVYSGYDEFPMNLLMTPKRCSASHSRAMLPSELVLSFSKRSTTLRFLDVKELLKGRNSVCFVLHCVLIRPLFFRVVKC